MFHFFRTLLLAAALLNPFKLFVQPATVAQKTTASIVRITGIQEGHPYTCTGFMVAPHTVLTAAHCVGESYVFDGFSARLIKKDEYFDLAVFNVAEELKRSLKFRDESPDVGEGVTAIGYGYGWDIPLILAEKVMIPDYPIETETPAGIIVQGGYIGGMSGGPVVDKDGLVVGIVQRSTNTVGYGVGTILMKAFLFDARVKM